MDTITVIKRNDRGQETWRYQGRRLEQADGRLVLEAFFDKEDMWFQGMLFGKGDCFIETYFTDRWYNIFEIHARDDNHLRGWYCNISRPVEINGDTISWIDLALDLLVFPDLRQVVLDEDEFARLEISPDERRQAQAALVELQSVFRGQVETPQRRVST
jgi:predicted RNA-binding protein associated with RNAse of E/G family